MGPSLADPRLRVAAVILSIHALGQGPLQFDVSVAQIVCALLVCALLEVLIVFFRRHEIVWPASALLTGSGVALLLRIPGTEHGDWFSLTGIHIVAATAALSLLSKYVLRVRGYQLFNPSNVGLVACFLLLGSDRVDPQDLWWGPTNAGLVIAFVLIVGGGLLVTRALGLLGMAAAFWITFASGVVANSAAGHCMTARWSFDPVCDSQYVTTLALSPEVLVFLFFMITDPRSTPKGRVARVVFGALVGAVAGLLVSFQHTEFATKVAILAALVVVCAARPLLGRVELPRASRGSAAVVVLLFAGYLVWVVGLNNRFGEDLTVTAATSRASAADVVLPPIDVDPDADRVAQGFGLAAARAAAVDLIVDLDTEVRAIKTHDADLARSSSTGARLDEILAVIEGRAATLPTYQFTTLRAVLSRSSPQAPPQLRFEARADVVPVGADGTLGEPTARDVAVVITMADGPVGTRLISAVA